MEDGDPQDKAARLPKVALSWWGAIGTRLADLLLLTEPLWAFLGVGFAWMAVALGAVQQAWMGLVVVAFPYPLRLWRRGYLSLGTPFDLPIAVFLAGALLGLWISPESKVSWGAFQTALAVVLFYYMIVNYPRPQLLFRWALVLGSLSLWVSLAWVVIVVLEPLPWSFHWSLPLPALPKPEFLSDPLFTIRADGISVTLVGMAILLGGIALLGRGIRGRAACGVGAFFFLGLAFLSPAKSVFLMLPVGFSILLLLRSRWLFLSLPPLFALSYGIGSLLGNPSTSVAYLVQNLEGRWMIWENSLRLLGDYPLTGPGLGVFSFFYPLYIPPNTFVATTPHSAYLQLYADTGVLGAIAALLGAVIFFRIGWRIFRASPTHPWRGVGLALWAALLTLALYGLFESFPVGLPTGLVPQGGYYVFSPLLWILGGFLVLAYRVLGESGQGKGS